MKHLKIFLFIVLLINPVSVYAIPTGTGGHEFPLGSDAGDDFIVDSDKLVVEGDNGQVGIGTTSPDADLDIESTEDTERIRLTDTSNADSVGIYTGTGTPNGGLTAQAGSLFLDQAGTAFINTDGGTTWGTVLGTGTADALQDAYKNDADGSDAIVQMDVTDGDILFRGTGATEILALDESAARIGIGTTSPDDNVEIEATTAASLSIGSTDTSSFSQITFRENGTDAGHLEFLNSTHATVARRNNLELYNAVSGGQVAFHTDNNETPDVVVDSGNVGIGTLSPSTALHVLKDDAGANVDLVTFDRTTDSPADDDSYDVIFNHENDNNQQEDFAQISLIAADVSDGTEGGELAFSVADGVDGSMDEAMRIIASGNVGIGVTDPSVNFELACPSGFTSIKAGNNMLGCMQNTEEGSASYFNANDDCFDTYGGRLPFVLEWHAAMANNALTSETDDAEITSNLVDSTQYVTIGNGSITTLEDGNIGDSNAYRCFIPS